MRRRITGALLLVILGIHSHLATKLFGGNMFPQSGLEVLSDGLCILILVCIIGFFFNDKP